MDEKILEILRSHRDRFISGQELARRTSLSQITVGRHIHKLRSEGYDIQTQPHWGYRLVAVPDRLLAEELKWQLNNKVIGRKILSYDTVDSTNTVAFSLAEKAADEGTVVFAEAQKKGRGRLGRSWISPKSKGIYLSLILRPAIHPEKASLITLLAALSCCQTIRKVCSLPALIRWPNDILINNKKVCGILTQMHAETDLVKFIILGIGINVSTPLSKLPPAASSLNEEARKTSQFSRLELARQLLRRLDHEYLYFRQKGNAHIITQWRNFSFLSGKRVKINIQDRTIEGLAQDVDQQGALIVRLDNGFKQHVLAADIIKVR